MHTTLPQITQMGILNVTPDSFSDGGEHFDTDAAIAQGRALIREGAHIVDIGGDSTRPGSTCVGAEEEWRRIEKVVKTLSKEVIVSVDTHFATTASRAIQAGAKIINDISGGGDPDMFRVIADTGATIIVMYSRCSRPHVFDKDEPRDLLHAIEDFFQTRLHQAEKLGIPRENILFDPGMGGFISSDPQRSLFLLSNLKSIAHFSPLVLGISRKKFLHSLMTDTSISIDEFGARITEEAIRPLIQAGHCIILRAHKFVSVMPFPVS